MKLDSVTYFLGDELESLQLWWFANGILVDFSASHSYSIKVKKTDGSATAFTKTTGVTGALGSGTKQSGTPNLTIDWATSGELNSITDAGRYICQIVALRSSDSKERTGIVYLDLRARIT